MANTKLTTEQKEELRVMREYCPNAVFVSDRENVVIVYEHPFPNSTYVQFSIANRSPKEQKFRGKVGKYHALKNFVEGQYCTMHKDAFVSMLYAVYNIYL